MKKTLFTITIILLFIQACDIYPQDDYEEFYVVESYLVADRQLPDIRLTRTNESLELYEISDLGISNADVSVRLLSSGPGSSIEVVFPFEFAADLERPGIYQPDTTHAVLPGRTYELHITFPDNNDEITAQTIIPGAFQVVGGVQDTITYQSSEQLEVDVSLSSYPGRQSIYIFNSIAQEPFFENITPFYSEVIDEDNLEDELERIAKTSSGIINEANFDINSDQTITIRYPWIGVAFFGPNRIVAHTIDDNIYDFVRSQGVQLGGSTLSPGEIQNVIYNIDGAIGIFGSVATDTIPTFIQRPLLP